MTLYHEADQYPTHDPVRRFSRGVDHHGSPNRDLLFGSYGNRDNYRRDPIYRSFTLSTPIHDIDSENNHHTKRRIQVACARCRKRKIRCSGDPGDASGCQACRNAGTDVTMCVFERVGTTWKFGLDTSGNGQQTTPNSSYGSANFVAGLSLDMGLRPLAHSHLSAPSSDRASFLDRYAFNLQQLSPESTFSDDRVWTSRSPNMGGFTPSYDPSYRLADSLAPLSISSIQGPPPPLERRLPAPNFVGTPVSMEFAGSPATKVSSRLAKLSISGLSRGMETPLTSSSCCVSDLTNSNIILPPVGRSDYTSIAPLQNMTDARTQGFQFPVSTDEFFAECTSPAASSTQSTALPPMQLPPNSRRYGKGVTNASPASKHAAPMLDTAEDRPLSDYNHTVYAPESLQTAMYGWTNSNEVVGRRDSDAIREETESSSRYRLLEPLSPPKSPCGGVGPSRRDKVRNDSALQDTDRKPQNCGENSGYRSKQEEKVKSHRRSSRG